jgi:hypothetical protein
MAKNNRHDDMSDEERKALGETIVEVSRRRGRKAKRRTRQPGRQELGHAPWGRSTGQYADAERARSPSVGNRNSLTASLWMEVAL